MIEPSASLLITDAGETERYIFIAAIGVVLWPVPLYKNSNAGFFLFAFTAVGLTVENMGLNLVETGKNNLEGDSSSTSNFTVKAGFVHV